MIILSKNPPKNQEHASDSALLKHLHTKKKKINFNISTQTPKNYQEKFCKLKNTHNSTLPIKTQKQHIQDSNSSNQQTQKSEKKGENQKFYIPD